MNIKEIKEAADLNRKALNLLEDNCEAIKEIHENNMEWQLSDSLEEAIYAIRYIDVRLCKLLEDDNEKI